MRISDWSSDVCSSDLTIPELHNYGAEGDPSRWADTSVIGSHVTVRQAQKNTDAVKQGRLSAEWKQDDFGIKFGGSYLEDHYKFQQRNTFANNFWQAYAGYGPASGSATEIGRATSELQSLMRISYAV